MPSLESIGAIVASNLHTIKCGLTDAKFLWHKENDPQGVERSPYDDLYDALPMPGAHIDDAAGWYRRSRLRTKGFVYNTGIPYFWLGVDAHGMDGPDGR